MSLIANSHDFFILSQSHLIDSTQIYHLLIKDSEDKRCYSFYFRYNSLKSLHKASKHKNAKFPSSKKTNNRINEFQKYFSSFLPLPNETIIDQTEIMFDKKHFNFKISNFLMSLGLESMEFIEFPNELLKKFEKTAENQKVENNKKKENLDESHPFIEKIKENNQNPLEEEIKSENPKKSLFNGTLISPNKQTKNYTFAEFDKENSIFDLENLSQFPHTKDEIFTLFINKKRFLFKKEDSLGGGGYGKVCSYSLNGSKEENHKFAIKIIESEKNDLERKMKSILAESKLFMKFDHENIVKGMFFLFLKNFVNFFLITLFE